MSEPQAIWVIDWQDIEAGGVEEDAGWFDSEEAAQRWIDAQPGPTVEKPYSVHYSAVKLVRK